jgi:hypothetical protein
MKKLSFLILFSVLVSSCDLFNRDVDPVKIEPEISSELTLEWADLCLKIIKKSPDNSPTYASRSLGYLGLTMYETVVAGSAIYQSIGSELNGLGNIPFEKDLDWEVSQSAGLRYLLEKLYPHALDGEKREIERMYDSILKSKRSSGLNKKVIELSISYGEKVAKKVYKWSKIDTGEDDYKRTFDAEYELPRGPQYWVAPVVGGQSPIALAMHPKWGRNRNFLIENAIIPIPEMIAYSSEISSEYYKQMETVYSHNVALSEEEKRIALWWGDDPSSSASPPGHSFYLAMQLIESNNSNLMEASAVLAKVGMATADAFINTWKCKYTYHTERPTGYIRRNIDENYTQFWPEPPFPSFISGHSSQIAAAVTLLINQYGNNQNVLDEFHKFRGDFKKYSAGSPEPERIIFRAREFTDLWSIAEECGWSRVLGGIHIPLDNQEGLIMGKSIGENISSLKWER